VALDDMTRSQIDALQSQIDRLWQYLGYSEQEIEARRAADEMAEKVQQFRSAIKEQIETQHDTAAKYMTVIATVGYAGYFALWTLSKDVLTHWQTSLSGFLGLISLSTFIVWEIFAMITRSKATFRYVDLVQHQYLPDEFFVRFRELEEEERNAKLRIIPIWAVALVVSASSALAGAGVLLYAFSKNLLL
jgi:hypothetical protein